MTPEQNVTETGAAPGFDVSIVSHGQAGLAALLLQDMQRGRVPVSTRLTLNHPEPAEAWPPLPGLRVQTNARPLGFAGNHNQAFQDSSQAFFSVVNPDIRLPTDPFPALLRCMEDPQVGLVAPLVVHPQGALEDSARHFPTPLGLLRKGLGLDDGRYHLDPARMNGPQPVEWVAGMFLFIRAAAFRDIGGFDDRFHLYYEDVDACARLWRKGWKVVVTPQATVVHDARRASRHEPRYMAWHAASMARYFFKHLGRLPSVPAQQRPPAGSTGGG